MEDRVYKSETDGQWYFYDETWNEVGPYQTQQDALKALAEYAEAL